MKVLIYYFSGTGNTLWCARQFHQSFLGHNCEAELISLDTALRYNDPLAPGEWDLMGLGFPIHGFNAPEVVFRFLNKLPPGKGRKVFLFKTPCDPRGEGTSRRVKKILTRKEYHFFHETLLVTPSNLRKKYPPQLSKALFVKCSALIKERAREILQGRERKRGDGPVKAFICELVSHLERFGARRLGKHFRVDEGCILCRKCYLNCPSQNIRRKGDSITFGDECMLCLRCLAGCPVGVIKPGRFKRIFPESYGPSPRSLLGDESIDPLDFSRERYGKSFYRWLSRGE